jgi:hypothetical protein
MGRRKILENVAEAWQPARIDNKKRANNNRCY